MKRKTGRYRLSIKNLLKSNVSWIILAILNMFIFNIAVCFPLHRWVIRRLDNRANNLMNFLLDMDDGKEE
jgi:hypothetical protein